MARLKNDQKKKIKTFLTDEGLLKKVNKLLRDSNLDEFFVESIRIRSREDADPCSKCDPATETCKEIEAGGVIKFICVPRA